MKYTWHVKWRRYNPISWILCWLFEQNVALMPGWFFYLHDWFCSEEREVEEDFAHGREGLK